MQKRLPLIDRMTADNNVTMRMQNEKRKELIKQTLEYNMVVQDFNKKRE